MITGNAISYLSELSPKQLKKIESISKKYSCKNGEVVYLQGEFCQNWIIVLDGNFLTRCRNENSIKEEILLPGDSFDFLSVFNDSVTSKSIESVGESTFLIIDILGLKQIFKKFPHIIGLIRDKLNEAEKIAFDICTKNNGESVAKNYKIKRSLKPIVFSQIMFFLPCFALLNTTKWAVFSYIIVWGVSFLIRLFINQLEFIEVNGEVVAKKGFKLFTGENTNYSAPMDKVISSTVNFKNRVFKVLKIGEVNISTSAGNIGLKPVSNPVKKVSLLNAFKDRKQVINQAIDLTSFRNLYSKKNNMFYLESQLNTQNSNYFRFKKSIVVFLIKTLPPVLIIFLISLLIFVFVKSAYCFLINIITTSYALWQFSDWVNDVYAFEGAKVIDIEKKPLWGKEVRKEADLSSVQSITKVQKNFFEYILNYGSIEIELIGSNITFPCIHNPDKVIENLYMVKKYYYSKQKSQEKFERQEEFLNYNNYLQELKK